MNKPFDFADKNYMPLRDAHLLLKAVMFPELKLLKNCKLTAEDYAFIKKEMSSERSAFRNWHNLLMSNLANAMIDEKLISIDKLKASPTFQHYYDSKQMYGKLLAHYNVNDKKKAAVEYFDIQIERYWPSIEATLKDYFSNE